jgi:hypothetical protein
MKRWKEIQQHVEEQPEDQYMRRIANQFENHQIDPRQSLANQIIASHLGNLTGSPSENAGKAWAAHNATMERDVDRKLESKERAANLYGKIKDSRINQGKVLGEFYGQEETRAQSDRHHGETLGESRRQFNVGQTNRNEDFGESRRQFEVGQTNRKEELAEQARQRKIAEAYTQKEHEQKAKEHEAQLREEAIKLIKQSSRKWFDGGFGNPSEEEIQNMLAKINSGAVNVSHFNSSNEDEAVQAELNKHKILENKIAQKKKAS